MGTSDTMVRARTCRGRLRHCGSGLSSALLFVALLVSCRPAHGEGGSYRFSKAIGDGPLEREDLVAVRLDRDVFHEADDRLNDVRVLDATGKEVPAVVERLREATMREVYTEVPAEVLSLREMADNRIEVTVAVERPADVLDIVTPLRDFEKQVTVRTAEPAGEWQDAVSAYPIFDYSRFMNVRSVRIPLPESTRTRYRIVIDNVTDTTSSAMMHLRRRLQGDAELEKETGEVIRRRDFRIDRLVFRSRHLREDVVEDVVDEVSGLPFRAEIDEKEALTVIRVPVERLPLVGVRLETSSRNFSRPVSVEIPGKGPAGEEWAPVATGTLRELSFRDLRTRELAIRFPERRASEIRIVVRDGEGEPLALEGVTLLTAAYRVAFLGYRGKEYRLAYGADKTAPPRPDTAVVRSLLNAKQEEVVTLVTGPQEANTAYAEPGALDALLRGNAILWVAIVLAVVVLAWGVAVTLRKVEAVGGDD